MEFAQEANTYGDLLALSFGAILFLLSGVSIGFLISRRRYLEPLARMESELRMIKNEAIRNKTFGIDSNTKSDEHTEAKLAMQRQIEDLKAQLRENHESSLNQDPEEPVFDSISEWTQKLIDFIDPIEIEVQSGDSDSVPVPEVNVLEVDASEIASESDQTSAEEKTSSAEPELWVRNQTPATVLALSPNQIEQLTSLKMNSFEALARLSPAGIIRLATLINVPIREIEESWIPEAESRLSSKRASIQTEGIEVNS